MTAIGVDTYGVVPEDEPDVGLPFWLMLCVGIAWILLSFLLLQFTWRSITALTALVGIVLIVAAVSEGFEMFMAPGWKWAHALLAILFLLGGIWAFAYPGETFGTLAILFGWYLIFKGTFDVVLAFMMRGFPLWWMRLISGFIEIGLAFWVVGYPGRSASLLVLWVGFGALMRGIVTIVLAFHLRSARKALVA
jgi:uncharacterized membrane protein HdeD (DUF308 family)